MAGTPKEAPEYSLYDHWWAMAIDVDRGIRQSPTTETIRVVSDLVKGDRRVIAFCGSRALTERVAAHHVEQGLGISGSADAKQNINLALQTEIADLNAFLPEANGSVRVQGTAVGDAAHPAVKLTLKGSQLQWQKRQLAHLALKADALLDTKNSKVLVHNFQALADNRSLLKVQGELGWANGLSWQAQLKSADLDPGLFAPTWPGAIHAELRSQGRQAVGALTVAVQIDKLAGTLRGFPLKGGGAIKLEDKVVTADDLRLQSGSTFVHAAGQAAFNKELALTVKAGSDDLSSLVPKAGGSFTAEGTISGPKQQSGGMPRPAFDLVCRLMLEKRTPCRRIRTDYPA